MVNEPLYEYNIANLSVTRKRNDLLWNQYVCLAERVGSMLLDIYGEDEELQYNIQRQYINYAINVIEEQIYVFFKSKDKNNVLRQLCNEKHLENAARYVMKYGKNIKERIQAWMFAKKKVFLIDLWISKR